MMTSCESRCDPAEEDCRNQAKELFAMTVSICSREAIELGPQHAHDLARLLSDLDPASRVSRFNCAAGDAFLLEYAQRALMRTSWLAGIFIDHRLRGIVEVYDMSPPDMIEVAILVDQTWRGRGLGTNLLEAAVQWAARSDRILLRMIFSTDNWPMRKLARKAHARLDPAFDQVVADIPITRVQV
jgi:GNAT superfamily N-acetyltransferase